VGPIQSKLQQNIQSSETIFNGFGGFVMETCYSPKLTDELEQQHFTWSTEMHTRKCNFFPSSMFINVLLQIIFSQSGP
jgi:hypothetical protein